MEFSITFCPYCGRTVDSSSNDRYVCTNCGKTIIRNRIEALGLIPECTAKDLLLDGMEAINDENTKKAYAISDEIVDSDECADPDRYFMRGFLFAYMGEDGRAYNDWKKGFELLGDSTVLDKYVCIVSRAITDMIFSKEEDYIEFSADKYVEKLADEIDASTGLSCKAFIFYSIGMDCMTITEDPSVAWFDDLKEVLPPLFKKVIAYQRNYWCLCRIIREVLEAIEYDPETYEDDDMERCHVYDLIMRELDAHIKEMTEEDRLRIYDHWNDKLLEETIEPLLTELLDSRSKSGLLGILKKKEVEETSIEDRVRSYVEKCLLIDVPEPEPVEEVAVIEEIEVVEEIDVEIVEEVIEEPAVEEPVQTYEDEVPVEIEDDDVIIIREVSDDDSSE